MTETQKDSSAGINERKLFYYKQLKDGMCTFFRLSRFVFQSCQLEVVRLVDVHSSSIHSNQNWKQLRYPSIGEETKLLDIPLNTIQQ